jgi:hypothetical protein
VDTHHTFLADRRRFDLSAFRQRDDVATAPAGRKVDVGYGTVLPVHRLPLRKFYVLPLGSKPLGLVFRQPVEQTVTRPVTADIDEHLRQPLQLDCLLATGRILHIKKCEKHKVFPYVNYRTDSNKSFADNGSSTLLERRTGFP